MIRDAKHFHVIVYSERRRSRKKQKRRTTFAGGERKGLARRWRAVFLLHSNTDWDMLSW